MKHQQHVLTDLKKRMTVMIFFFRFSCTQIEKQVRKNCNKFVGNTKSVIVVVVVLPKCNPTHNTSVRTEKK